MSYWYLIELRQRTLKRATFECIFEVQGRTRIISSAEEDDKVVLSELFPPEFLHALEEYERQPCRTKLTLYQLLRLVLQPTSQIPHTIATPSEEASVAAEELISEPMQSADDAEFISAFLYGLRRYAVFSSISVCALSNGIQSLCAERPRSDVPRISWFVPHRTSPRGDFNVTAQVNP